MKQEYSRHRSHIVFIASLGNALRDAREQDGFLNIEVYADGEIYDTENFWPCEENYIHDKIKDIKAKTERKITILDEMIGLGNKKPYQNIEVVLNLCSED